MPRMALSLEIGRDEKSEELRILYVALTRAKQKLIIISAPRFGAASYLGGISKKLAGERDISPFVVRTASSMSDWLTMCAMLHPDGAPLREYSEMEVDYEQKAEYPMECRIITELAVDDGADAPSAENVVRETDSSVIDELARHASFSYPYGSLRGVPVKVAASDLAHKQSGTDGERYLDRPAFLSDESLDPAEKGTALHAFMQFADFAAAREDIRTEIERLTAEGYLTQVQADSIDIARAGSFIRGDIVDRALASGRVYKEYRFNIRIPVGAVAPELSGSFSGESVVLQGAVDLAFEEDGALVIVDYKTDRVKRPEELVKRYSAQLELYRTALEQCLGLPVRECIIYSVRHSKAIKI